jgi:hypothetical protein
MGLQRAHRTVILSPHPHPATDTLRGAAAPAARGPTESTDSRADGLKHGLEASCRIIQHRAITRAEARHASCPAARA